MGQIIELPDEVFARLQAAAAKAGQSPAEFIADVTSTATSGAPHAPDEKRLTLRERMSGSIGAVHSGLGKERLSENRGEKFTGYLEQKRREGRL